MSAPMNTTGEEDDIITQAEQATNLYDELLAIIRRLDKVIDAKVNTIENLQEEIDSLRTGT